MSIDLLYIKQLSFSQLEKYMIQNESCHLMEGMGWVDVCGVNCMRKTTDSNRRW